MGVSGCEGRCTKDIRSKGVDLLLGVGLEIIADWRETGGVRVRRGRRSTRPTGGGRRSRAGQRSEECSWIERADECEQRTARRVCGERTRRTMSRSWAASVLGRRRVGSILWT